MSKMILIHEATIQQALEALKTYHYAMIDAGVLDRQEVLNQGFTAAIAIKEALAEQTTRQEPVAIEYWLQDTMESGRWVTTNNMAKATAEKMLSGEYGDVYPQGRIVEPSPPAIEAKLKEKNT